MKVRFMLGVVLMITVGTGCAVFRPAADLSDEQIPATKTMASWIAEFSEQSGLNYVLTFPAGYLDDPDRRWPMIIFLHSMEERGELIAVLFENGSGEGMGLAGFALNQADFSFVTLSPLCPDHTYWFYLHDRLASLIGELLKKYPIDASRLYLSGVSMGGMGTWSMAMAYPKLFAAAAPIAGGVYSPPMRQDYDALVELPVWAFHDRLDPSIPLEKDERAIMKLLAAGGDAQLSILETGKHYIQQEVFNDGAVFSWFQDHERAIP